MKKVFYFAIFSALIVGLVMFERRDSINEDRLWVVVNEWRMSENKPSYVKDDSLCSYANQRVQDIQTDFSHDKFVAMKKVDRFIRLGENLSRDFQTNQETLTAWLNSPKHRENLDDNYEYSCIRCSEATCVQLFGKLPSPLVNDL